MGEDQKGGWRLFWQITLSVLVVVVVGAIVFPLFVPARYSDQRRTAIRNLKVLQIAMVIYTTDYDDQYMPEPAEWDDALLPYVHSDFWYGIYREPWPHAESDRMDFTLNGAIAGQSREGLSSPEQQITMAVRHPDVDEIHYEPWPMPGRPWAVPASYEGRFQERIYKKSPEGDPLFAFADTHVERIPMEKTLAGRAYPGLHNIDRHTPQRD